MSFFRNNIINISLKMLIILMVLFAIAFCYFLKSQNNFSKKNNTTKISKTTIDSLDLIKQQALNTNSFELIEKYLSLSMDSIDASRNLFIHHRRIFWQNFDSFQKTKYNSENFLQHNPCYTPLILKIDRVNNVSYNWIELFNKNYDTSDFRAKRFIVADFNTTDTKGNCKGCSEKFAIINELSEFKNLRKLNILQTLNLDSIKSNPYWQNTLTKNEILHWINLQQKIEKFRTEPQKIDSIIIYNHKKYCYGQTLNLCEIQGDTIINVAQFITSSRNVELFKEVFLDFDKQPRFYAPINTIKARYWDNYLKYDSLDYFRDIEMGFASSYVIKFKGKVPLPNFLTVIPDSQFSKARSYVIGIHEVTEGGYEPLKYMGSPVSLGCIRLFDYPAKFTRWWTPFNAKLFISYENKRYKQIK